MSEKSKREIDKQALDESIIKWEAIVGEYEKGNVVNRFLKWQIETNVSTGLKSTDCPLCILYHPKCDGCPLKEADDECGGLERISTWDDYNSDRNLTTAAAMLNKLKELRRAYD